MRSINRIFFHFIMAYIVLIFIPLLSGIFLNRRIVLEYEKHVKESHLTYLKKTQEVLESFVEDIKWSTYQLANNTKLLRLISDKDGLLTNSERNLLIRETMQELKTSVLYNTSFDSTFYIYLKTQDIIITPYSYYSHEDFTKSFNFFKMESIKTEDWHLFITNKYQSGKIFRVRSTIIEDFKNKKMLPYVQTLPTEKDVKPENITGAIVYLIGEADFIKFLDYKSIPKGGYSYIADEGDNILSKVSNTDIDILPTPLNGEEGMIEVKINNKPMFVIYTTSKRNNWKYVSVLPREWVLKNVHFYQFISIIVLSIALIICLSVAYILSKQWSGPLIKSINSISDYLKISNINNQSFKSLNHHVNSLINQTEEIQDELLSQKVFVHNAFVNRVINGFFKNESSLNKYLNHIGFNIQENSFNIAILSLRGFDLLGTAESFEDLNKTKNFIKSNLQMDFPIKIMVSEQENADLIVIFMTNNKQNHYDEVYNTLELFFDKIPGIYKSNLTVAIGETVDSLIDIHKSFIQAQDIISVNNENSSKLILTINDMDKKLENYYYPIEIESRLINSIKSGNMETSNNLLDVLHTENYLNRTLDRENQNSFYSNLMSTYNRISNQLSQDIKDELSKKIKKTDDLDMQIIRKYFLEVCSLQNSNKKSHNNLLSEEVKNFLNQNYSDKNLSLYSVAEQFSITESYLSFFFKEQTGTNFSTFLESIRIENAKTLLIITDHTIHSIAEMVGYNSDKTFRRVFQKNLTISPSKYRIENRS